MPFKRKSRSASDTGRGRFRVIEVQRTPNPNAIKFVLDGTIAEQTTSFLKPESAKGHPLAEQLFAIEGVQSVLLLGDFVTINKSPTQDWTSLTAAVKAVLEQS